MKKLPAGFASPLILVAVGLIVGIGITFAYFQFKSKPAPQPQPTTTPQSTSTPAPVTRSTPATDETASWKTYTSAEMGFSIKYPDDMYSTKIESTLGDWKGYSFAILEPTDSFNNKKPLAVTYRISIASVPNLKKFTIENPKGMFGNGPLEEYIPDFLEGKTIMETSLGAQKAFIVRNLAVGQSGLEADIYAIRNDRVLEIAVTPVQITGDSNKNFEVLDQILSTFQFIN